MTFDQKPCMCGNFEYEVGPYVVYCPKCGLRALAANWNHRPYEDGLSEELRAAKARIRELEQKHLDRDQIAKDRQNFIEHQTNRIRELEEAMPKAETMRAIARLLSPFNSLLTAKAIEEMADRIEKVMKK